MVKADSVHLEATEDISLEVSAQAAWGSVSVDLLPSSAEGLPETVFRSRTLEAVSASMRARTPDAQRRFLQVNAWDPEPVSRGDSDNYCRILSAELRGEELLLVGAVSGALHTASSPEIMVQGRPSLTKKGARTGEALQKESGFEVSMVFPCPHEMQRAGDVFFRYAPGYSAVSILEQILLSLAQQSRAPQAEQEVRPQVSCESEPLRPSQGTVNAVSSAADALEAELDRDLEQMASIDTTYVQVTSHHSSFKGGQRPPNPQRRQQPGCTIWSKDHQVPRKQAGWRPILNGGKSPRQRLQLANTNNPSVWSWHTHGSAVAALVEAGKLNTEPPLRRQLIQIQALRKAWAEGDLARLAAVLEASRDDSLASSILSRLQTELGSMALPAHTVARLLPLLQRLAQSDSDEHALVAMRVALWVVQASWTGVSRSLKNIATPKVQYQACEEATTRLQAFFSLIKSLSKSVRISRTNGPLVAACRRLKSALEEALAD